MGNLAERWLLVLPHASWHRQCNSCALDMCCTSQMLPPNRFLFAPVQTANAGVSSLQLQDPVKSWEAGQQVVITTTIWKDEQVGSTLGC